MVCKVPSVYSVGEAHGRHGSNIMLGPSRCGLRGMNELVSELRNKKSLALSRVSFITRKSSQQLAKVVEEAPAP